MDQIHVFKQLFCVDKTDDLAQRVAGGSHGKGLEQGESQKGLIVIQRELLQRHKFLKINPVQI